MVLPVHLLVCSHGLWGEPEHMAIIVQTILETHIAKESPEYELEILSAETNKSDFTYDGIGLSFAHRALEITRLTHLVLQIGAASAL
jgi:hypothetical protein